MKHEVLRAAAERCGVELSASQALLLERYEQLLASTAITAGMVASGDAGRLRDRHILDCLRAAPLVPPEAEQLCDLGSGAGLPGLVLALALPAVEVTLTESRRTRVAFLELAISQLGLSHVHVHHGQAQELGKEFDVCTARAFASLGRSWVVADPLLTSGGCLLYWAGRTADPVGEIPSGTRVEQVSPSSALARSGPVVIMTRQ